MSSSLIALPQDLDIPNSKGLIWVFEFGCRTPKYEYAYEDIKATVYSDELSETLGFLGYLSNKYILFEDGVVQSRSEHFQLYRYLVQAHYISKDDPLSDPYPFLELFTSEPGIVDLESLYQDWKNTIDGA